MFPVDKCRKRWVTLRDYFFRKYRESKTTTSGQAASKKRKWHVYDYMLLLIPTCATVETCSNRPESDNDTQTSEDEQSHNSPLSLQPDDIFSKTPKKTPRRKKRKSGTGTSEIDTEILKALREPEPQLDENELFFKSLLPS